MSSDLQEDLFIPNITKRHTDLVNLKHCSGNV